MPRERYVEGNIPVVATTGTVTTETNDIGDIGEGLFLVSIDVHRVAGTPPVLVRVDVLQRSRTYTVLADWSRGVNTNAAHGAKWWTGSIPILRDAILRVAVQNATGATQTVGVDFILSTLPLDGGVVSGRTEGPWEGATWTYHAQITNGGGGGGTIEIQIVPGAGNEMEILYARVVNGDTASRVGSFLFEDDDDNLLPFHQETQAAGSSQFIPCNDPDSGNHFGPTRMIMSGTMKLTMEVLSVAAGEDASFAVVARIRGGVPTVTEAGNSTPTITINKEQVF